MGKILDEESFHIFPTFLRIGPELLPKNISLSAILPSQIPPRYGKVSKVGQLAPTAQRQFGSPPPGRSSGHLRARAVHWGLHRAAGRPPDPPPAAPPGPLTTGPLNTPTQLEHRRIAPMSRPTCLPRVLWYRRAASRNCCFATHLWGVLWLRHRFLGVFTLVPAVSRGKNRRRVFNTLPLYVRSLW